VNLETINTVAQLVAAFGVVASLFYLSVQIRQNTISQRAIVVDSLAHAFVDLLGPQAIDADLANVFASVVADWDNASLEQRGRAITVLFPMFKVFEDAWFQYRHGTLDAEHWEGWDAFIRMYYHQPGVQVWWRLRRAAFARGFREYLEKSVPVADLPAIGRVIAGGSASDGLAVPERPRA
jgi:hypothetical protein